MSNVFLYSTKVKHPAVRADHAVQCLFRKGAVRYHANPIGTFVISGLCSSSSSSSDIVAFKLSLEVVVASVSPG